MPFDRSTGSRSSRAVSRGDCAQGTPFKWLAIGVLTAIGAGVAAQAPPRPARTPDVIFIESTDAVTSAMLKLARVTRDDVVYDLGCGDGKIVIAAAKTYGARGVGIDIDPALIQEATAKAQAAGVSSLVTFRVGDIFSDAVRIGDATVVALYLLPSLNQRLRPKLWRELKPGTRVISNSFGMGSAWPPLATEQVGDFWIYLWRTPG